MDIAGNCNYETIVYVFVKWLEKKLYTEIAQVRNKGGNNTEQGDAHKTPELDANVKDKQVAPLQDPALTNLNTNVGDVATMGEDRNGEKKYLDYGLRINPATKKIIIKLEKVKRQDLNPT